MFIKYKGTTSALLKDLALELRMPVDLKASEEILKAFLGKVAAEIGDDKSIELICCLPPAVKPFCSPSYKGTAKENDLFSTTKKSHTINSIMKVLEKYIQPENLAKVYSCFPETLFTNSYPLKKQILQEIYNA